MKSKNMSKILMDNILYICLLLMIVIIAIISPSFISVRVLSDVLTQSAPKMLLAVGMLVVIIAGGMDMTASLSNSWPSIRKLSSLFPPMLLMGTVNTIPDVIYLPRTPEISTTQIKEDLHKKDT